MYARIAGINLCPDRGFRRNIQMDFMAEIMNDHFTHRQIVWILGLRLVLDFHVESPAMPVGRPTAINPQRLIGNSTFRHHVFNKRGHVDIERKMFIRYRIDIKPIDILGIKTVQSIDLNLEYLGRIHIRPTILVRCRKE